MGDVSKGAPDSSAQALGTPDNAGPPPESGAQGPVDSPTDVSPVVDDQQKSDETTPKPEDGDQVSPPASEQMPYWEAEGFRSEEDFINSYKEGRTQIGKIHREAGDLRRANEIYRKHANNELEEGVNVEDHIAAENKKATEEAEKVESKNTLANKEASLALETFKVRHKELSLDHKAISRIIGLANVSRSQDFLARLEDGLAEYTDLQNLSKTSMVKEQQDDMKDKADLGPGSSSSKRTSDAPDYKRMSSEEFASLKHKIASQ